MTASSPGRSTQTGLSARTAALTAGLGLLVMTACAPAAWFHFMPQSLVEGDGAATLGRLRTDPGPFLIGIGLLFTTYVMDVVVAWALYWLLRPGQAALSLLVAWMRIVYTCLAFLALVAQWGVYRLATSTDLTKAGISDEALAGGVMVRLAEADASAAFALLFFGVHLLVLAVAVWRSVRVPSVFALALALAGLAYVVQFVWPLALSSDAPGWTILMALGELAFMLWLLISGWRLSDDD